jgi:hypothetical protein
VPYSSGALRLKMGLRISCNGAFFVWFVIPGSTSWWHLCVHRDYFEGLAQGFFTKDPSKFNNASVCQPYVTQQWLPWFFLTTFFFLPHSFTTVLYSITLLFQPAFFTIPGHLYCSRMLV